LFVRVNCHLPKVLGDLTVRNPKGPFGESIVFVRFGRRDKGETPNDTRRRICESLKKT